MRMVTRHAQIVAPARHLLDDACEFMPWTIGRQFHAPNGVSIPSATGALPTERKDVLWYYRKDAEVKSVELFQYLALEHPELSFSVIGEHLQGAPANVINLGWVRDVLDVCAKHKVLLNTTAFEGMPNVALQALATGSRVLGTTNNGLIELADQYPGYVTHCPAHDKRRFSISLTDMVASPRGCPQNVPKSHEVQALWQKLFQGEESSR